MNTNIIPISKLRKRFGEIENALPYVESFTLTKKGVPFAILSATPETKRNIMRKTAGAFKGTLLGGDKVWKEVMKRKSRKAPIHL